MPQNRRRREVVDIEYALRAAKNGAVRVLETPPIPPPVALSVHAHQRCEQMGVDPERVRMLVASPSQVRYGQPFKRWFVRSPEVPEVLALVTYAPGCTTVVTVIWPHEFVR